MPPPPNHPVRLLSSSSMINSRVEHLLLHPLYLWPSILGVTSSPGIGSARELKRINYRYSASDDSG
ncbi:hypothetical protein JZ751_012955 [Albula glossodonta]|uniref:Uncharacterized protein n=1 Tax=Albula glossodonta TaxID=121402 RepID=A0A8T2MYM3_9TELE|nr:hypothetical protein JZ751_012955 [Albula glossodonta]